ncbi:hypothetical protein FM036_44865, partial [Nostoc sp. HG1]|nr:hypothetical protein [Nostoc sp. HG1]
MNITTLTNLTEIDLRNKLEMFLFNKLRISPEKPKEPEPETSGSKQSYFTFFKKIGGRWVIYVSTHEQEREAETLFGKSWTIYCMDLLNEA